MKISLLQIKELIDYWRDKFDWRKPEAISPHWGNPQPSSTRSVRFSAPMLRERISKLVSTMKLFSKGGGTMEHRIVSREEWLVARKAHLAREKELTGCTIN